MLWWADMLKERLDEHSWLVAGVRLRCQFHLLDDPCNRNSLVSQLRVSALATVAGIRRSSLARRCSQHLWIRPHSKVQSDDL